MVSPTAQEVVNRLSNEHARAILLFLCSNRRVLNKTVSLEQQLLGDNSSQTRKRKADSAIAICVQCKSPFDPGSSVKGECCFHEGELEVDYDLWPDHDEDCHGPIDTDENREDRPEGFLWTCCDEDGLGKGCTYGRHLADANQLKKGNFGDGDEDDDDDDDDDEDGLGEDSEDEEGEE